MTLLQGYRIPPVNLRTFVLVAIKKSREIKKNRVNNIENHFYYIKKINSQAVKKRCTLGIVRQEIPYV